MSSIVMAFGHKAFVLMALCSVLWLAAGCASRPHQAAEIDDTSSIERPAVPLGEEQTLSDRFGEMGIVLLVIAVAVGGILIPILLL